MPEEPVTLDRNGHPGHRLLQGSPPRGGQVLCDSPPVGGLVAKFNDPPGTPVSGKVLTTGKMAVMCKVAARTISKWFDAGYIKGYTLPISGDRRIPIEEARRFMREWGIPVPGELLEDEPPPTAALLTGPGEQVDLFDLGGLAAVGKVSRLLLGCAEGKGRAEEVALRVQVLCPHAAVAVLLTEDVPPSKLRVNVFQAAFQDPGEAAAWLYGKPPGERPESPPAGP